MRFCRTRAKGTPCLLHAILPSYAPFCNRFLQARNINSYITIARAGNMAVEALRVIVWYCIYVLSTKQEIQSKRAWYKYYVYKRALGLQEPVIQVPIRYCSLAGSAGRCSRVSIRCLRASLAPRYTPTCNIPPSYKRVITYTRLLTVRLAIFYIVLRRVGRRPRSTLQVFPFSTLCLLIKLVLANKSLVYSTLSFSTNL